ncbi:MAG: acyltransferase [Gemmataceae bacterium]
MNWSAKLRRGSGPIWGPLKRAARVVLTFHVPAEGPARYLFGTLYRFHVVMREAAIWAARFFWFEPLFRSQCASVGAEFQMESLPYLLGCGRIHIGRRVRFSGKPSICFSPRAARPPELTIGDGTFVGHQCAFNVGRSIRIGSNCLLAGGVRLFDMDGHPLDAAKRRAGEPTPAEGIRPVVIGDDVWIGTGAIILKGVTIGDRSIVAASAVVTRSVPADVVVAGNPARVVKALAPKVEAAARAVAVDLELPTSAIHANGVAWLLSSQTAG